QDSPSNSLWSRRVPESGRERSCKPRCSWGARWAAAVSPALPSPAIGSVFGCGATAGRGPSDGVAVRPHGQFAVAAAVVVGLNRTVTFRVAFSPVRLNVLPYTMLKGAGTDTVPSAMFCTVMI